MKLIRRGITQKKEYNIQNTAKVPNQLYFYLFIHTCATSRKESLNWKQLAYAFFLSSKIYLFLLDAGLLPRKPLLDPRPVHVLFMMGKVTMGQVFPQYVSSDISGITLSF